MYVLDKLFTYRYVRIGSPIYFVQYGQYSPYLCIPYICTLVEFHAKIPLLQNLFKPWNILKYAEQLENRE